ncbi:MAG: hypothetical protein PSX71_08645 [bacterium]|nr:hypothetical protein [bacterium]
MAGPFTTGRLADLIDAFGRYAGKKNNDGTEQLAVVQLDNDTTSYGIAPTGTVGTGASAHWTAGTVFDRIRSEGMWLYIGAVASTPALSAGWYWVVMSTTAIGTIYTAGPGSAPFNFSAGAANTGVTTEQVLPKAPVPIAAGAMGAGTVSVSAQVELNVTAGTRTAKVKIGGTNILSGAISNQHTAVLLGEISNKTSAIQVGQGSWLIGTSAATTLTAAIDTTQATTLTYSLQMAAATDWVIFERIGAVLRPA